MELQGDAFSGNVKIKLGLINLSYRGQAHYVTNNADFGFATGPPSSGPDPE
jgi:hypothetical protein